MSNNITDNFQILDLEAFKTGGEYFLQAEAATGYEDAEDRICAFWDKAGWVLKEMQSNTCLHPKVKEVLHILIDLLDSQCRQEFKN